MLSSLVSEAKPYVEAYGYWAVAAAIFLEDFGLPLPGETILLSGAALAAEGYLNLRLLLIVSWLAAVAGDNMGYAIGRFGGRRLVLRYGHYVLITKTRLRRVEGLVDRYGPIAVVAARFVSVVRQLNGIVAGISLMRWWRFCFFNALGGGLWVGLWGVLFWLLGGASSNVFLAYSIITGIGVTLMLATILLSHRLRR